MLVPAFFPGAFVESSTFNVADELFKGLAIVVAGAWTYLNYVRGRTFRTRLEIELSGSIGERPGVFYFNGQCKAKNVGLSLIPIQQVGSGIVIYALWLVPAENGTFDTFTEEIVVLPIFTRHGWIEPGESISDTYITTLPPSRNQLLGVRTEVMIGNGKTVWNASQITEVSNLKKSE